MTPVSTVTKPEERRIQLAGGAEVSALLIMPAKLGMPTFTFNTTAWQSLMGHLIYGLVLGIVYALLRPRLRRT